MDGPPHLAQDLEAGAVDTFQQPVDRGGAELVHGDGLIAERHVPRTGGDWDLVEHRRDDGALGEAMERGVGDDEHETARLVPSSGEPDLAR